jgi:hypothetical protein
MEHIQARLSNNADDVALAMRQTMHAHGVPPHLAATSCLTVTDVARISISADRPFFPLLDSLLVARSRVG